MPELHRARSRASIARAAILLPILGLPLLLAACRAEPPPAERPPEPQAQAQAQAQQAHEHLRSGSRLSDYNLLYLNGALYAQAARGVLKAARNTRDHDAAVLVDS